jgi:hypothetical protein
MSGNPSGRPRGIEARCREFTKDALQALVAALANPKERVQAASTLLAYGWGRPKQTIEADGQSIGLMHLLAAKAVSEELGGALLGDPHATPLIEGHEQPSLYGPALE